MRRVLILVLLCFLFQSCFKGKPRVLVFSKTKGYRHASINAGKPAIQKLGLENEFEVDTTELASYFNDDSLKRYSAVVFLSTTGDVLDPVQQVAFKRFIQAGGGFVGIHAAADTEYDWLWYGKLVGAWFKSHPKTQQARILKQPTEQLNQTVPEPWKRTDEWYNYKNISEDLNVLFKLDETSYEGGDNNGDHPLVWYHSFDGGRAFYTGMGHTDESYTDPDYLAQVLMGIRYAIGDNDVDYRNARDKAYPEANRFSKEVFAYNFNEPTEMTVLPDGRIIFIERGGAVKMLRSATDTISVINRFNVNHTFEDGMIGIAHHPDFAKNNILYIFYSHPTRSANVLSQFNLTSEGVIDMQSEKEILEVVTQRDKCCHTGGSLAFGPGGNLFISTGDNTSPFESDGFSPSDEQPGRAPFDAQKSSSNTNDLRGKVLRIHPEIDGTYTIPDGNLFAKGEPDTRPEIYVMGCRNPYRISVDAKTGFVYWGDVGPDAGNDNELRGPRGYDEVNQARKPGFFGWPLFIGKNYAYADYDFATKTIGPRNDPMKPVNNSPNNTGKKDLPPVSPPFIWYPYAQSPDFPGMTTGSRNAMAGPIYYAENFSGKPETAFPDYLDSKLITYDWMRGWVRLVSMDKEGNITDIEPFLQDIKFNNLIDMQFGPDGRLYTLEYGTQWNKQNMDSRLSVINFERGNRRPRPALTSDVLNGAVPLTVNFSAAKSVDYDGDQLSYELQVDGKTLSTPDGIFKVTFDKAGIFRPKLIVQDGNTDPQSIAELTIIAGNSPPVVGVQWTGNQEFFFEGGSGNYEVTVEDQEDGSLKEGQIDVGRVNVSFDFLPQGYDITLIAQGHQRSELPGKILMAESDCKTCHMVDEKSAGPSYKSVAAKYEKDAGAIDMLSNKILKGGAGVWGDTPMAAHPQLTKEQTMQMVQYILTLNKVTAQKSLPLKGNVKFDKTKSDEEKTEGSYILTATYEDRGTGTLPSLSGERSLVLRAPVITGSDVAEVNGPRKRTARTGKDYLENIKHGSTAVTREIDLTGVGKMEFNITEDSVTSKGGTIDVYLDSREGKKLGTVDFKRAPRVRIRAGLNSRATRMNTGRTDGLHRIYLVFNNAEAGTGDLFTFRSIDLEK